MSDTGGLIVYEIIVRKLLAKTNKKLIYFILFLFKKNNNECLKNVSISH